MRATLTTRKSTFVLDLNDETGQVDVISHTKQGGHGVIDKAVSWLTAEASMLMSGPISDEQFNLRIAECKACDRLQTDDKAQVGFCSSCGCGKNVRSELSVKARMPSATCPLNKWPKNEQTESA